MKAITIRPTPTGRSLARAPRQAAPARRDMKAQFKLASTDSDDDAPGGVLVQIQTTYQVREISNVSGVIVAR